MQPTSNLAPLFAPADAPGPPGLRYQADFLSFEEERSLIRVVEGLSLDPAQYKEFEARRRIASFGGRYDFSTNVLEAAPELPPALHPLRSKVATWLRMPPERFAHALVAEYRPGTPLGWHRDVPQFELIVGISLAGWARLRFRPYPLLANKREGVLSLTLEPRSVYVLRGDARWRWQHSVSPTKMLRYSITFRTMRERNPDHTT